MEADLSDRSHAVNLYEEIHKRKRGDPKFKMPDRFLRGGIENQPETFQQSDEEIKTSESTGGSNNSTKAEKEPVYFFKRKPMVTETAALYQLSHLLTDSQNNRINKLNFYLEVLLTLNIFISSFLVLTLEPDFWLPSEESQK